MKRLQINGVPILNILDLRSLFSPLALYQELGTFEGFAAVHCVPLPLQLTSQEDGTQYSAECLTKTFWHGLLRKVDWPNGDLAECLTSVLSQELDRLADGNQEERAALADRQEKELTDAALLEKLDWIMNSAKTDVRQTMLLLAICELVEIDPRKTAASDWRRIESTSGTAVEKQPEIEVFPKKREKNSEKKRNEISGVNGDQAILFPYEGTAYLTAGSQVYRYWCYDGNTLEPGAIIQTVRLEAKASNNQYAVVRIELHSEAAKRCVQSLTLNSGEFCYCTVCQRRIIRFLPNISVSDDLCLFRSDYRSADIQVLPKDGETWPLSAQHVSCFSAGSKSAGFLLVQDGRINSSFYTMAQDYMTKLQLEMLMLPVVEARVLDKGYEVLLEDGTTATNLPSGSRTGVLTLDAPLPMPVGISNVRELAISQTGQSAALLMVGSAKEQVFFSGAGRAFQVPKDGTIVFRKQSRRDYGD